MRKILVGALVLLAVAAAAFALRPRDRRAAVIRPVSDSMLRAARLQLDNGAIGPPITFMVDGQQRVAVTSSRGVTVFGLKRE